MDIQFSELNNVIIILYALGIISVLFSLYYYCKFRQSMSAAETIIATQTEPADNEVINELIEQEKHNGNAQYVLKVLTSIRRLYGHQGVKVGHVVFILKLIEKGCPDIEDNEIPSFSTK